MRIMFYGRLAESIGGEVELDVGAPSSVGIIRERLASEHPAAAESLRSARALACVDGVLVRDDHVVASDQRLEFLPPLSGG
jgi:molybdopterin converting factor small subunit